MLASFGGDAAQAPAVRIVRKPPGGGSSLNLGWGNADAPGAREEPLTPSRRGVVRPPGGSSSVDLSWNQAQPRSNASRSELGRPTPSELARCWALQQAEEEEEDRTPTTEADASSYARQAYYQQAGYRGSSACGRTPAGHLDAFEEESCGYSGSRFDEGPQPGSLALGGAPRAAWEQPTTPSASGRQPQTATSGSDIPVFEPVTHGRRSSRCSSNDYACGSQQNCGNILTDTPSTRVHAPPGGASSICLGWDADQGNDGRTPKAHYRSSVAESFAIQGDVARTPQSQYRSSVAESFEQGNYGDFQRTPRSQYRSERSASEAFVPGTPKSRQHGDSPSDAFGQRVQRSSSNAFAHGSQPNSGNMLTSTPTTRVSAPPGGASNISLGWDYEPTARSGTPRTPKYDNGRSPQQRTPQQLTPRQLEAAPRQLTPRQMQQMSNRGSWTMGSEAADEQLEEPSELGFQQRPIRFDPSTADVPAGMPSFDSLRTLKQRMSKKKRGDFDDDSQSKATGTAFSEGPWGSESAVSRLDANKEEIAGSKPRKWKPAIAPRAPPGGQASFHPAKEGQVDPRSCGKKLFPESGGAGSNRDPHAMEALRFYQDERLGKHAGARLQGETEKHIRDTHRYYLAAEGKAELVPGKAGNVERRRSEAGGSIIKHEVPTGKLRTRPAASAQSTSASGAEEAQSECDSLPLGAEWSTWGTPREARGQRHSQQREVRA